MPSKIEKKITKMLKQAHKSFITEGKNNTTMAQLYLGVWVNSDQENRDSANGQQIKAQLLEALMPLSRQQKRAIAKKVRDPHKSLTEIITKIEVSAAEGEEKANLVKRAEETAIASGGESRNVATKGLNEDIRKAMKAKPTSPYSKCLDSNESLQDFIRHLKSKNIDLNSVSSKELKTQYKSWQESQPIAQTVLSSLTSGDGKYIVEGGNVYKNLNQMLLSSLSVLLHSKSELLTSDEKSQLREGFKNMGLDLTSSKMPYLEEAPSDDEQHDARGELLAAGILVRKEGKLEVNSLDIVDGKLVKNVTDPLNTELKGVQGIDEGNQEAIDLIRGLRTEGATNIDPAVPANGAAAIAEQGLNVSGEKGLETDENESSNTSRHSGPQA